MLDLMKGDEVIGMFAEGGWFRLPSGETACPAHDGWTNGVYRLVARPDAGATEIDPDAERADMVLSFAQMVIGLVSEGWITEADGEGWLAGVLPPTVLATINLLPAEQRFAAKAKAARPSTVARLDPLVEMMALAQGRSPAEIDSFFRTYATV